MFNKKIQYCPKFLKKRTLGGGRKASNKTEHLKIDHEKIMNFY